MKETGGEDRQAEEVKKLKARIRELEADKEQLIDALDGIRQRKEAEHRRLEENYRTLFREMLDGFAQHEIICNADGSPVDYRFLNVNPAFERMTGLKAEAITGKTVLEVLPGTETHWIETYGKVALTGEPVFFDSYSRELDRHFKVTAFRPAPGQFACIFTDITDRKRAEEERARLNADLTAKNTELEQVVYVASHDLRSPLVNIDGYSRELEYALEDLDRAYDGASAAVPEAAAPVLKEDIPEAVRFIRTSASKMDRLLKGLLHLSRSGRAALNITELDMNRLISDFVDAAEFQLREAGVRVELTDLPACRGDAVQVNQVFSNLLDNALKYLEPGRPGLIRITGKRKTKSAVYCVEDNGIGINPAHLDKIFEIFHRLDPSDGDGEGLGLTIVRRILDRLEGDIRVTSDTGAGSRFYVTLPSGRKV